MEQKEQQDLLDKIKGQVQELLKDTAKGFVDKEDFNSSIGDIQKSIGDLDKSKEIKELSDSVLKMAEEFNKLKTTEEDVQRQKGFNAMLAETLLAKADVLSKLNEKQDAAVGFKVKAAGTMLRANILPAVALSAPMMLTSFDTGITGIARRSPFLRQIMNTRPINTQYAAYSL